MYKIVRYKQSARPRTIKTRLTLEQAQAHCRDPLTHGLSNPHRPGAGRCPQHGVLHTERCRPCDSSLSHDWFDGYTET